MSGRNDKLDFWLQNSKSVAIIGRSGVGKTAISLEAFIRNGISLSRTSKLLKAGMSEDIPDGILRDALEDAGYKERVAYWSPTQNDFENDPFAAKVLFFDDLSTEQARRALSEVLNLRVWKGQSVSHDFCCWACLTPDLDPVLDPVLTQFEIVVQVPYRLNKEWLTSRFGAPVAGKACQWWDRLDEYTKDLVSPRTLTRALDMWAAKGDIRDCLPLVCNTTKLRTMLEEVHKGLGT